MFTRLPIISNSLCKQWDRDKNQPSQYVGPSQCSLPLTTGLLSTVQIDETLMCTGLKEGGRDACKGDSGGGLLYQEEDTGHWVEVGIISSGYKCGLPRVPGIYTRVATFSGWIQKQVS